MKHSEETANRFYVSFEDEEEVMAARVLLMRGYEETKRLKDMREAQEEAMEEVLSDTSNSDCEVVYDDREYTYAIVS